MNTLERIQQLDDFKALRLFKHLQNNFQAKIDVDAGTLVAELPEGLQELPEVQELGTIDEAAFEQNLDTNTAIQIARQSLELMATNPGTEPYLAFELDNWKDTEMIAGTLLAIGGALSLVMLLATLNVSYNKEKGFEFSIGFKNKDQIEPLKLIFKSLFKIMKPGPEGM